MKAICSYCDAELETNLSYCYVCKKEKPVRLRTIIRKRSDENTTEAKTVKLPHTARKILQSRTRNPGIVKGNMLSLREQVYRRDGRKCLACGTEKNLTMDHIIPKSKGGYNSVDNLQTLCKPCNMEKGDRIRDYRVHGNTASAISASQNR